MKILQKIRKHSGMLNHPYGMLIFFGLVVATIFLGTSISAYGQDRVLNGRDQAEQEIRCMEKVYRQELRDFLNDLGFSNSGINMTKMCDGSGILTYTVLIHHRRISGLDMEEINALLLGIAEIELPVKVCYVIYRFM